MSGARLSPTPTLTILFSHAYSADDVSKNGAVLKSYSASSTGSPRWIRADGYRPAGPRREIYRGKLLEIQYPIESV